eukprot:GHVT01097207.1.p1 GENE.GHVT01097207.1~~GHVT01097207.1.p1  ORF type:complete len:380 (+),score=47.62 GHVT01097207.1:301-1440(+)
MAPPAGNGAGRVPGSFPPLTPLSAPNSSTLKASALRIGKPRHDGRRLQEMRNIYMRVGPVPGASGSSYITLGNTKLTCIVEGPRPAGASAQPNRGSVSLDLRVASCALKDLRTGTPLTSTSDGVNTIGVVRVAEQRSYWERLLLGAVYNLVRLEAYPKSQIDLIINVLEDDGGVLTAALTAASLALVDAGVEVNDIAAAVSVYACPAAPSSLDSAANDSNVPSQSYSPNQASSSCSKPIVADSLASTSAATLSSTSPVSSPVSTDSASSVVCALDLDAEEQSAYSVSSSTLLREGLTVVHLGMCPGRSSICFLHVCGPFFVRPYAENVSDSQQFCCRPVGGEHAPFKAMLGKRLASVCSTDRLAATMRPVGRRMRQRSR